MSAARVFRGSLQLVPQVVEEEEEERVVFSPPPSTGPSAPPLGPPLISMPVVAFIRPGVAGKPSVLEIRLSPTTLHQLEGDGPENVIEVIAVSDPDVKYIPKPELESVPESDTATAGAE